MLFISLLHWAFAADFTSRDVKEVYSHGLLSEMVKMTVALEWDQNGARALGLRAMDYPEVVDSVEVKQFYARSVEIDGPVLLKDLVLHKSFEELLPFVPILRDYFQKYRFRHVIRGVSQELIDAVDVASLASFRAIDVRYLALFLLHPNDSQLLPGRNDCLDYHSTKMSLLIRLHFQSGKEILAKMFTDGVDNFEQLEVMNELNLRHNLQLDTWIQTKPPMVKTLLRIIRSPMHEDVCKLMPKRFDFSSESYHYGLFAFVIRKWGVLCNLPRELIPKLLWKHPDLIPALAEQLPVEMPAIQDLIPEHDVATVAHVPLLKHYFKVYGFKTLKNSMFSANHSSDMFFYLYLANDGKCGGGLSLDICTKLPSGLFEMERASWLAFHFSRIDPVSEDFVLGFSSQ